MQQCIEPLEWKHMLERAEGAVSTASVIKGCHGATLIVARTPEGLGIRVLCLGDVHGPRESHHPPNWLSRRNPDEATNLQLLQALVSRCKRVGTPLTVMLEEQYFRVSDDSDDLVDLMDRIHRRSGLVVVRNQLRGCLTRRGACVLGCHDVRVEAVDARLFDSLLYRNLFRKKFACRRGEPPLRAAERWYRFFVTPSQSESAGGEAMWSEFAKMGFGTCGVGFSRYRQRYFEDWLPLVIAEADRVGERAAVRLRELLISAHLGQFRCELDEEGDVLWVTMQSIIMDYYTLLRMLAHSDTPCVLQAGTAHTIVVTLVLMLLAKGEQHAASRRCRRWCDRTYRDLANRVFEDNRCDTNVTEAAQVAVLRQTGNLVTGRCKTFGDLVRLLCDYSD